MNLWRHRFSKNMNQISVQYCATLQGRNPYNFWFKRWLHKFILKFTDLYDPIKRIGISIRSQKPKSNFDVKTELGTSQPRDCEGTSMWRWYVMTLICFFFIKACITLKKFLLPHTTLLNDSLKGNSCFFSFLVHKKYILTYIKGGSLFFIKSYLWKK